MKRLFLFFAAVIMATSIWAQSPQTMSYQAVIRDASNKLMVNKTVGMQISILQGFTNGTAVYIQTQKPATNTNGLVSIEIGGGVGFGDIDWTKGPYFIKTETDPTGGTNYTISGTSQLLSVPYALHAKFAENFTAKEKEKLAAISGTNTGDQDLSGYFTTSAATAALNLKVDQVTGKGLSTEDYTTNDKTKLASIIGTNTGDQDLSGYFTTSAATAALNLKVDQVTGKGLSTEDYTTNDKTKLASISGTNTGDQDLSGYFTTLAATTVHNLKVDKEAGKGLSTEDYSSADKAKLAGLSSTAVNFSGNLAGDVTGTQSATSVSVVGGQSAANVAAATDLANSATNDGIAGAIVKRDASGDFTAGTITANVVGNLTGNVTGNATTATTAQALSAQYIDWGASTGPASVANKPVIPAAADGAETKVTAGSNLTVTGTGTTASPYVINAIPALTQVKRDALTPVEGLVVYNTSTHKPNYYNGTGWLNYDGTTAASALAIGDLYQGGIIAYIFQSGDPGYVAGEQHGIIAALADESPLLRWDGGRLTVNATGTALGTGAANTAAIVSAQGTSANYAARACIDLVEGGYFDWFLPSLDEMTKVAVANATGQLGANALSIYPYWSSSEVNLDSAYLVRPENAVVSIDSKVYPYPVRAIRTF
jgi:hypothetical protein